MERDGVELWLVRHGETTYNATRQIAGWCNPPLTDLGRREAAAVAPVLDGGSFDSSWSSDLDRAMETARLAWGPVETDRRLRECNFGVWEGRRFDEVDADDTRVFMEFRNFDIEGGDSHETFSRRIHSFVGQLPVGRHLLFVHGGVIRILTQDIGLDRFVATGSVVGVDWIRQELLFVNESTPAES